MGKQDFSGPGEGAQLPGQIKTGGQKKIDSIQVLRGLAAFSVVFYHLTLVEKKYAGKDIYLPEALAAGRSGVDLFFVISGFIMVLITRKKWGEKNNSLNFLLHRGARIYPNYWFYFLLTLAVFWVQPSFVNASQGGRVHFLSSFFLFPSASLPLVMVAWSLIYELYFYLVFSLLMRCRERVVIPILLLWIIVLAGINLFLPGFRPGPVVEVMISPYSIEFILGALSAIILSGSWIRRVPDGILFFVVGASVLSAPLLFPGFYGNGSFHGPALLTQALVFGIIFALLVLSLAVIELKREVRFWRWLIMLGDISFTVYLSQLLVIGAIGRIWSAFFLKAGSWVDNAIALSVMVMVIVVYSYVAYRLIERRSYNYVIGLFRRKGKAAAHS
ncbi:MAG TPA: acyltransferase [Puia sp.]|nr:acyltransferase [Puia sp.]